MKIFHKSVTSVWLSYCNKSTIERSHFTPCGFDRVLHAYHLQCFIHLSTCMKAFPLFSKDSQLLAVTRAQFYSSCSKWRLCLYLACQLTMLFQSFAYAKAFNRSSETAYYLTKTKSKGLIVWFSHLLWFSFILLFSPNYVESFFSNQQGQHMLPYRCKKRSIWWKSVQLPLVKVELYFIMTSLWTSTYCMRSRWGNTCHFQANIRNRTTASFAQFW